VLTRGRVVNEVRGKFDSFGDVGKNVRQSSLLLNDVGCYSNFV